MNIEWYGESPSKFKIRVWGSFRDEIQIYVRGFVVVQLGLLSGKFQGSTMCTYVESSMCETRLDMGTERYTYVLT